ncbi:MAG: hypothetical protein DIZ80_10195 [endosymbiont of Galathealinum brachiosum]|uniref:GspL cytoplasmic actin-ATPase-like domain-containing protein n=1 Tax=endosymbiont of Galathealinum brachiosum TaxID=2200906 RepID=A0A370DCJ9_9GAMM|nr:MAG: hypothetical protein DIZ80_10195 [endosymbiont of Galathealinum brachiosum]
MATDNTPVRILVDLIEEDFKKETIPHVGSSDRKSIVSRLIERHYRKSKDYVHYNVVDRETGGRKDDVLLYSVLSNPEILEPWLKPIQESNTSVSGIWSLPLLSEKLFKKIDDKTRNVLLVSQQVPSNLRQTFIKDGKFESSRSAVVNLEDATIGEYIALEVEQTIRFLSNQRHIGFDEKIEVHIICRDADLQEIQSRCIDSAMRTFHYHELETVTDTLGCDTQPANNDTSNTVEYSNGIYSYVCASQIIPIGHYGNRSLFAKFYEQLISKTLYTSSAIMLLISFVMSFSYLSESAILDNEAATLITQKNGVNNDYERTLAKLKPKLDKTQVMQSSVLLTEKIKQTKILSPQNFMVDISRILTRSGMYDTEITKVSWQQHQSKKMPASNNNRNKATTDYARADDINQHAVIGGYIRVSQSSLKESVNKVNSIVSAFKNNKLVHDVIIKRMPVDVRSKSSIENESGVEHQNDLNSDKEKGQFEIELIMKGRES